MFPLEHLPRWLRVATRAAFFALAFCLVISCLPVWNRWDDYAYDSPTGHRHVFWVELANAVFGDKSRPGRYLVNNLLVMTAAFGLAFLTALIAFWFGPRVKDKEDEPRRLGRPWEPDHAH